MILKLISRLRGRTEPELQTEVIDLKLNQPVTIFVKRVERGISLEEMEQIRRGLK